MLKILFLIITILINCNSYANENKILIKVNNKIITSYDIFTEIKYLNIINKNYKQLTSSQSIGIAKNSLIKEKIKEIELKNYIEEIKLKDEELHKILIRNFNYLGIASIRDFNDYFTSKEIDPNIIRKKVSIEILWNQLIYAKFNDKVRIDINLIKKEVNQNNKQKQYLLSEILFNLDEGEKFKDKLKKINNEIEKKSFSKAALEFSISDTSNNGGKLGWVKETVLSKEIKDKLNNINVGEHTNPITIPGGFLILKVENTNYVKNDNNSKEEINNIIKIKTDQQLNQFSNVYFNKIKKDIQINEL